MDDFQTLLPATLNRSQRRLTTSNHIIDHSNLALRPGDTLDPARCSMLLALLPNTEGVDNRRHLEGGVRCGYCDRVSPLCKATDRCWSSSLGSNLLQDAAPNEG